MQSFQFRHLLVVLGYNRLHIDVSLLLLRSYGSFTSGTEITHGEFHVV